MATEKKLRYIKFDIGVLHLELTSRCNALCPMCGRTTGMDGAVEGGEVILKKRDDVELLDTDPQLLANMIEEMKFETFSSTEMVDMTICKMLLDGYIEIEEKDRIIH